MVLLKLGQLGLALAVKLDLILEIINVHIFFSFLGEITYLSGGGVSGLLQLLPHLL